MHRCVIWLAGMVLWLSVTLPAAEPAAREGRISEGMVAAFRAAMSGDPRSTAVINAVTRNDVKALALNREAFRRHDNHYTNTIKGGQITNQKASGRCWLFAGFNILRLRAIKKYNLADFELSQNYSFFWDKLEKANLFLEGILGTLDRDLDDRLVTFLLKNPFSDGGQWNMVVDLVEKYGVVPASVMPDTKHSAGTGGLNRLMSTKLRRDAAELRRLHAEGKPLSVLRQRKVAMLSTVYRILCYHFGEPPATFRWRFQDKAGKLTETRVYTPQQFLEEAIDVDLSQYVYLYNSPAHPYGKLYEIQFDRDLVDRPNMTFANVDIELIKKATLKQILDGEPVWFGCDVGKEFFSDSGILQTGIYDYKSLLGIDLGMTKAERILYRESVPTHAMVFLGVDIEDGRPRKWRVENSWGSARGDKGYLSMYDAWFNEYLYAVIVNTKYLPEEVVKIFKQKPVSLPPWDPMFDQLR